MKRTTILLLLLISYHQNAGASAQTADNGLPGYFLDLGFGARALSMGRSFTAVSGDFSAMYWNPAGLSRLENPELSVSHVLLFEDTVYDGIAFARRASSGAENRAAYGAGLIRLYTGGITSRDENNVPGAELSDTSTALFLSGSYRISNKLSAGACAKSVNRSFDDLNNSWHALDASAVYALRPGLETGVNIRNLAVSGGTEKIPASWALGVACRFPGNRLLVSADICGALEQRTKVRSGLEWPSGEDFQLRGGYDDGDFTGGFGVRIRNFRFDYALLPHPLGMSYRATLTYRFFDAAKTVKVRSKDYRASARVMKEIPMAVYHLFDKKGVSVINLQLANNTTRDAVFKISYRMGLKNPVETRNVTLTGNTTKTIDLIPSVAQQDIRKIGTIPTPDNLFMEIEEISGKPETLLANSYPVTLLPYDQFVQEMTDANSKTYELLDTLASWVTTNDRKLEKIISQAGERGLQQNPQVKMVGFLPPHIFTKAIEDKRTFEEKDKDYISQIRLMYEVLKDSYSMVYLNKPMVYNQSQRINLPSVTLENKGNCIELSVLFASLLESIEISPILVLFPDEGHAAVGWKLEGDKTVYHFMETNVFGESFDRVLAKGKDLITEHNLQKAFDKGINFGANGIYTKGTSVVMLDIKKIREQVPPSPYIP